MSKLKCTTRFLVLIFAGFCAFGVYYDSCSFRPSSCEIQQKTTQNEVPVEPPASPNPPRGLFYDMQQEGSCSFEQYQNIHPRGQNISFYLTCRQDGVGTRVMQVLMAVKFAHQRGWKFGGMADFSVDQISGAHTPSPCFGTSHDIDVWTMFNFLFGRVTDMVAPNGFDITSGTTSNYFIANTSNLLHFQIPTLSLGSHSAVHLINNYMPFDTELSVHEEHLFSSNLRSAVSCGVTAAMRSKNYYAEGRARRPHNPFTLNVAVHIRRGDINALSGEGRFLSDEYYATILKQIRDLHSDLDVHIFTSASNGEDKSTLTAKLSSAFIGAQVHIDVEENGAVSETSSSSMVTIAHLITADVLVTGMSTFSLMAAYFNAKCVVYIPFALYGSMSHWIHAEKDINTTLLSIQKNLPSCLEKDQRAFWVDPF